VAHRHYHRSRAGPTPPGAQPHHMISRRLLEMTHCLKRGARPGLTRWDLGHGFAVGAGQDKERLWRTFGETAGGPGGRTAGAQLQPGVSVRSR
jgi:hypothetical protein